MENVHNDFEGWEPIIDEMRERLRPYNVYLFEAKEKWGILTVFYRVNGSKFNKEAVRKIIEDAEDTSSRTCQYCGRPAETDLIDGWHRTASDKYNERMKTKLN